MLNVIRKHILILLTLTSIGLGQVAVSSNVTSFTGGTLAFAATAQNTVPYQAEPWYLSNPITRTLVSVGKAFYQLLRIDQMGTKEYWQKTLSAFSEAIGHVVGLPGEFVTDLSRFFNRSEANAQGFHSNRMVLQCTSFLPVRAGGSITGALTQMRHSWIQVGNRSYGMPYTTKQTYFGGDSVIYSPDPFVDEDRMNGVICTPMQIPAESDEFSFTTDFACIADRLSVGNLNDDGLATRLTYNALTNNCVAATNFLAQCAGGRVTQNPNLGVGSRVSWDRPVMSMRRDPDIARLIEASLILIEDLEQRLKAEPRAEVNLDDFDDRMRRVVENFREMDRLSRSLKIDLQRKELIDWTEGRAAKVHKLRPSARAKSILSFTDSLKRQIQLDFQYFEKSTYRDACQKARMECRARAPMLEL